MEPFQHTMSLPALLFLIIGTMSIFIYVIMMGAGIYKKENDNDDNPEIG
ncbi:MAG: hypothetical protein NTZ33_14340 [Bacteroidetes bacterium]|nr:hypothetical protein [Bacteroidota bacterium]